MNKKEVMNAKTVAIYSGLDGIAIKDVVYQYGETYIVFVSGMYFDDTQRRKVHRCKVYYTNTGNSYFTVYGRRVPLQECIKVA